MMKLQDHEDCLLIHRLRNSGQTNLCEWAKKIVDEFCEEQAIEERTSFNDVKNHFHDDLLENFLCIILILLFKFLVDKGVSHIVEPQPLLIEPRLNIGQERLRNWEKFVNNQ